MKSLTAMASLCLLGLFTGTAQADDSFEAKARFTNPAKLPAHIVNYLSKEVGRHALASCQETKPHELFEAEIIPLNKTTKAYLVKPAHTCLCKTPACPVWMFQAKGSVAKPIWHIPATDMVEVLEKKLNGYRKLREVYTGETEGRESIWSWDRVNYMEIYKNTWTMDAEKKCRLGEETIQLVDGKMINHTIKCPQD